jgi:hypothetical protein
VDDHFLKIATGKVDVRRAVLSGALVFEPLNLELAKQRDQPLA